MYIENPYHSLTQYLLPYIISMYVCYVIKLKEPSSLSCILDEG